MSDLESTEGAPRGGGREPTTRAVAGRTAVAQRAFDTGDFERAASELARCSADDEPAAQLRIAQEMESIAHTARELGELLVRFELADRAAPVARLGQRLLGELEGTLPGLRGRAGTDGAEPESIADPAAPPEPGATPEELEDFLDTRVPASIDFLRMPFGNADLRKLHLVERDHQGYDIWWRGCFFAVPHGHSPRLTLYLIRLLDAVLRRTLQRAARRLRAHMPRAMRSTLKRWLSRSGVAGPFSSGLVRPVRVHLLSVRVAATALELQRILPARRRRAPRGI